MMRSVLAVIMLAGLLASGARAADPQPLPDWMGKGRWGMETGGSYLIGEGGFGDDLTQFGQATVGVSYFFRADIEVVGHLSGYGAHIRHDSGADTAGVGFDLLLRWHFVRQENYTLYLDGGAGIVEFESDFPQDGTRFNFIERIGPGVSLRLGENARLLGGVRVAHLSNAYIEGHDGNPAFNGAEFYVGFYWPL